MRRVTLGALSASILLLAGCITAPEELDATAVTPDSPLLSKLGAFPASGTFATDALVLRTVATTDGAMSSFWWEIPAGVILEENDDTWIEFLATPVLLDEDMAALERWSLLAFTSKDGMLALNSLAFGAPLEVSAGGLMGSASETVERSLDPFLFGIGGKLRPGMKVGFVVAGVASRDVEMALVLKPLPDGWDRDDDVPEDAAEYLAALGATPRVALPELVRGGTHQVALLFEGGGMFGGFSVSTGPIERDGSATSLVVASRRADSVSTGFDAPGYGLAAAGYQSSSYAGSWSAIADAHGSVSEASGPIASTFTPGLTGWPFVVAIGEGEAPARTSLSLNLVSASFFEGLYLIELDLGTTLLELFGMPALKIEDMGGSGEATREGDTLAIAMGDLRIHGVGVF